MLPPSPQKKKNLSQNVQPKGKSELMGHSYALLGAFLHDDKKFLQVG